MNQKLALIAVAGMIAIGVVAGCSAGGDATASADEEKAFKTRKAELPANFSTAPKNGVSFVGESKSTPIGTAAQPTEMPKAGAGGTGGGSGGPSAGAAK